MNQKFGLPKIAFLLLFLSALTVGTGELALRLASRWIPIYSIEMMKYARDLKIPDPLGLVSHVHRPNASARLMKVELRTNSLGNRGQDPIPGRIPLLVLGSSVTMGWGVPENEIFTERLAASLNAEDPSRQYQVHNAGIGNYSTEFQAELFRRQFPVIRPKLVVLNYFVTDVEPRPLIVQSRFLTHSYLLTFIYDAYLQISSGISNRDDLLHRYEHLYEEDGSAWRAAAAGIERMSNLAREGGAKFVVMLVPDAHNLAPDSPFAELYRLISGRLKKTGIEVIDPFPVFSREFGNDSRAAWVAPGDPHLNGRGHTLLHEVLFRYISDHPADLRGEK